jgi:hypothetical protein
MIVASVLLRSRPMSFRSLLMMFGSLLVHILRHIGVLAILRQSSATPEVLASCCQLGRSGDFGSSPFFGQLARKPQACLFWLGGVSDPKHNSRSRINRCGQPFMPQGAARPYRKSLEDGLQARFEPHCNRTSRGIRIYFRKCSAALEVAGSGHR